MIKKLLSIILSVAVALTMMPAMATVTYAEDLATSVKYIDENGEEKTAGCTIMTSGDNYSFEAGGWYAVTSDVTINNRIENNAPADNPAHLILTDGSSLVAAKGIHNPDDMGLVIYGQSSSSGQIKVEGPDELNAGIGGNANQGCGYLEINGGNLEIRGGKKAAGIGGGDYGIDVTVTINNGKVAAYGGNNGAGIGTGCGSTASYSGKGAITINGGTVDAVGGEWGAGIGRGYHGYPNAVKITGGTVTAKGGSRGSAGIGGGTYTSGVDTEISGGTVCAIGNIDEAYPAIGSGIGSGHGGEHRLLKITGERIDVRSGTSDAAATASTVESYERLREPYVMITITHDPTPVHVHSLDTVKGQAAACNADGWKDCYKCSDEECGKYFEDPKCATEIGDAAAYETWKTAGGRIAATGHNPIMIPQQDATAAKDGVKAYYVCKNCDACFEDAKCTIAITDIEAWKNDAGKIAKHSHSYGEASYFWNDDLSECTAYHTCTTEGCGYTEFETVTPTEESGIMTATFTKAGFETQQKDKSEHKHSFSDKWSSNDARHWHAATCGCDDIVSGFEEHTWGTGEDADKCTACGYVKQTDPEGHVHTFDTVWSKNETVHWHAATCAHTEITSNMASHEYGDDNICDVCGYEKEDPKPAHEHTFASDWSKNGEYHWHAATCEHKDVTSGHAKHNYNAGTISKGIKTYTCQTCGYQKTEKLSVTVPKTSIKSVKRAKKAFTVKWTKKSVTGYQIQYARNSKFTKSTKTVTVKSASTVSKKIKSLKKKKRYYVRVRCYINKYDTTYYSGWSSRKSVRTR